MAKYVYLKEPGILYDMVFLLKLRFNGERAYEQFKGYSPSYNEDVKFYNLMINKTSDISEKLLPLFYFDKKTPLLTLLREVWDEITVSDKIIENFYTLLSDSMRIRKYICSFYFPDVDIDFQSPSFGSKIKDMVIVAELPDSVKLYLINFLIYGDTEMEFIINQLHIVQALVEESYNININEIERLKSTFADKQIENVCKMLMADLTKFDTIYFTYCTIYIDSISSQMHKDNWIAVLGIHSESKIYSYSPSYDIDLYELGRVLYEETRLKILDMLTKKEMYCAEIARELGLKNNSTIYHLGMMVSLKLLDTRIIGNKVLYHINDDYLNAVKQHIDKILLMEEQCFEKYVE